MFTTPKTFLLLLSITTAYVVVANGDVAETPAPGIVIPTTSKTSSTSSSKPPTTSATTPSTSSTTAPPKTTTTTPSPKPTTPTPVPDPTEGLWWVNATNSNVTCVVLEAALRLDVSIKEGNATRKVPINVPATVKATGTCDDNKQQLQISWNPRKDATNQVTFVYLKRNDSKFELSEFDAALNLTIDEKPGFVVVNFNHQKEEFVVPTTKSYKCAKEQTLELISEDANVNASLKTSNLQMEAFRKVAGTKFADAVDCLNGDRTDVVPIAVGCALAVLVLIVLGAYLVGRRRSQARGYLSM